MALTTTKSPPESMQLEKGQWPMKKEITGLIFSTLLFPNIASAQIDVEFNENKRHHISTVIAGSYIDEADETVFTLGIDYEYRVSEFLGLGAVVEYAFGELDATTVLAVADLHLWRGLALQVGPGIEFVDDETFAIGRIGALYEHELPNEFTISPQLHYDISGGEDTIVFGIAIGRAF